MIHRDYDDLNGYLYAVADEDRDNQQSTLQIIDIRNLPESIELIYDSAESIRKVHNIFIDEEQSKLYTCSAKGGDAPYSALRIYDISNIEPELVADYTVNIGGVGIASIHDAYVRNNVAYLNAGNDGLLIVNFSSMEEPEILSTLRGSDYPESGYNHSGWLSDDGNYYYFSDESWGNAMKVYDVSDPANIILASTFDAGNDSPFSIPHNQIVLCNYIFTSYYYDGLQVHDISNPRDPVRVMYFPTTKLVPRANYEGAWGVYPFLPSGNILVSDMQNGLFIIEKFIDYCSPSSIEEQLVDEINIKIYPNPSRGQFTISSDATIDYLKIFNLTGATIFESNRNIGKQIELEHLHAGIYFAQITVGDYKMIEKIIIQY